MTDSTAEPAGLSEFLTQRASAQSVDERRRNIRRAIAGFAVLLLHILALSVFIYSGRIPPIERIKATVPEPILWLLLPHPKAPPRPAQAPAPMPEEVVPELTAPITLPPIRTRPLAPPPSEGLLGIGRSLACGASIYENLPPAIREQCLRHPWHFVQRADGSIGLEALPPKPAEPPPPTAAEVMRHEQQTAPPCPLLTNVPCLGKVIHGDPLGGQPSPF